MRCNVIRRRTGKAQETLKPDILDIVERAYRVEGDDEPWCRSLLRPLADEADFGIGTAAMLYDVDQGRLRVLNLFTRGDSDALQEVYRRELFVDFPPSWLKRAQRTAWGIMTREPGSSKLPVHLLRSHDVADFVGFGVAPTDGLGVRFDTATARVQRLSQRRKARLDALSLHIATAYRLRRRMGGVTPSTEHSACVAVFSPEGRTEHSTFEGGSRPVRERLRAAVLELERLRGALRKRDPDEALRAWPATIDGRWTLVDRFESDGRRYIVALENPAVMRLSARERDVAERAAQGLSNKEIAADLNVAHATVRVLLHRAAVKLGVRTRAELLARFSGMRRRISGPL